MDVTNITTQDAFDARIAELEAAGDRTEVAKFIRAALSNSNTARFMVARSVLTHKYRDTVWENHTGVTTQDAFDARIAELEAAGDRAEIATFLRYMTFNPATARFVLVRVELLHKYRDELRPSNT